MQTTKLIFLTIPLLLSGCAAAPLVVTGIGIGSVAVTETTGKTATDHVVSAANGGQDCRVGRTFRNEAMCQAPGTVKLDVVTTQTRPSSTQEIQDRYR